jgi:hypothetical protein
MEGGSIAAACVIAREDFRRRFAAARPELLRALAVARLALGDKPAAPQRRSAEAGPTHRGGPVSVWRADPRGRRHQQEAASGILVAVLWRARKSFP